MPFGYYHQLNAKAKRIYRASDKVSVFPLPNVVVVRPVVRKIFESLQAGSHLRTQKWAQRLLNMLTSQLHIRPIRLELLDIRPSNPRTELYGLYYPAEGRRIPRMQLWMRTAKRHQVVAFRTFLRTLLHELCHHLDYDCLGLKDSFHTQGFYQRESSLASQILPLADVSLSVNGTNPKATMTKTK
jgi:WLM domain